MTDGTFVRRWGRGHPFAIPGRRLWQERCHPGCPPFPDGFVWSIVPTVDRMLFRRDILQGIAEGRVTLAFRRWRRAPPADGSSLRSPVGVLCLDRVTVVDEGDVTAEDVRRTGMSPQELRASIAGEGALLRIELRLAGDDPRIALRERLPAQAELEAIVTRLARIDAACPTPWTTRHLRLIAERPGVVSRVLAPQVDADVLPFKRRVRQLKELGLTESLEVGYRLSPRGRAVLERLVGEPR